MTIRKHIADFFENMFGELRASSAVQMDARRLFARLNREGIFESDGTLSERTENSLIVLAARAAAADQSQIFDRCITALAGRRVSPGTITRYHAEIKALASIL